MTIFLVFLKGLGFLKAKELPYNLIMQSHLNILTDYVASVFSLFSLNYYILFTIIAFLKCKKVSKNTKKIPTRGHDILEEIYRYVEAPYKLWS